MKSQSQVSLSLSHGGGGSQGRESSARESLATADKLESALKSLTSRKSKGGGNSGNASASSSNISNDAEAKAAGIRVKLCELFSDILLTDCAFALRKDITHRLWHNCFYERIQQLRQRLRVAKEKSRKRERELERDAEHSGNHNSNNKYTERVQKAEESLQIFIKEGIQLYEFLVDRFQANFSPATLSQSQSSQSQSQTFTQSQSQASQASATSSNSSVALQIRASVPIAHKLYIHLGDLFRYASNFAKAEHAYMQASKLAPSKGNPFNQMAVVAQLKESSSGHPLPAIALYWYSRSLAALEVFETSQSNVERLFSVNEKWLQKNASKQGLALDGSTSLTDLLAETTDKEQLKRIKSMASQVVLSRFVSFHGKLYAHDCKAFGDDDAAPQTQLLKQMQDLLDTNPFGDGLLIKLVAIAVFSLWKNIHALQKKEKGGKVTGTDVHPKYLNSTVEAYRFLLQFAAQLTRQTKEIMLKIVDKFHQNGAETRRTGSIRFLGPLLLLCEYVSHHSQSKPFQQMQEAIETEWNMFWAGVGEIGDMVTNVEVLTQIVDVTLVRNDAKTIPDDFLSLSKGCKPFAFLTSSSDSALPTPESSAGGYITPEEAAAALGLLQKPSTPKDSNATCKIETQTRIKLVRFMAFVSKHLDQGELTKAEDGRIQSSVVITEVENEAMADTLEADGASQAEPQQRDNKCIQLYHPPGISIPAPLVAEDNDVLVYKQSKEGQPALLVPNALLLGNAGANADNDDANQNCEEQEEEEGNDDGSSLLKLSAMILPTKMSPPQKDDVSPASTTSSLQNNPIMSTKIRPPPGFQIPDTREEKLKSQILPPFLTTPQAAPIRTGPPPGLIPPAYPGYGGDSTLRALPPTPQPPLPTFGMNHQDFGYNLPQTRNPFASSRLTRLYGVDFDPTTSASGTLSSGINLNTVPATSSAVIGSLPGEHNNFGLNRGSLDHDPFGLGSLGIFDDKHQSTSDKSTANHHQHQHQHPRTLNPFY